MSLSVIVGIPTSDKEETIRETLRQLLIEDRSADRNLIIDASTDQMPDLIDNMVPESEVLIDYYEQPGHGRDICAASQNIYDRFDTDLETAQDREKVNRERADVTSETVPQLADFGYKV